MSNFYYAFIITQNRKATKKIEQDKIPVHFEFLDLI